MKNRYARSTPVLTTTLASKLLAKALAEGRKAYLVVSRQGEKEEIPRDFKGEFVLAETYDDTDEGPIHVPELDEVVLAPDVPEHLETEEIDERWRCKPFQAFQVEGKGEGMPPRTYFVH